MKKFLVSVYVCLGSSAVFSLINVVFRADISVLAFPFSALFTGILSVFVLVFLLRKNDASKIVIIKKMLQYLPFVLLVAFVFRRAGALGTSYWFDLLSVLLWLVSTISAFIVHFFLEKKRLPSINSEWAEAIASEQKTSPIKRIFYEVLEWLDAFVQAAFTVALLNIFIVQLYEIPSESMVPEFLVKDRVVVFKTASGPRFPLSDVGIPRFRSYDRGDIVVFRNPHYAKDRREEVKTFVSQLVYTLTLTMVNLNVDADGIVKADPLVKRVCGMPGEQLMMQDGVLYSRTSENHEFEPVTEDALWAEWNLASLPAETLQKIQYLPLSEKSYQQMLDCESQRNALSYIDARQEALSIAKDFSTLREKLYGKDNASTKPDLFSQRELYTYMLFAANEDITSRLLTLQGGTLWFEDFMTSWLNSVPEEIFSGEPFLIGGNLYTDSCFRLNLMIKLNFGRLVVRNAELLLQGISVTKWKTDQLRVQYLQEAEMLDLYTKLMDSRNMPIFPANSLDGSPNYIPEDCYFMMGDNRFNSLDMRHSYESELIPLTEFDAYSAWYYSKMAPQTVSAKDILGTTVYRFWPWSRRGVPGLTGKS